jgi:lysophospholipase L1-like esterase
LAGVDPWGLPPVKRRLAEAALVLFGCILSVVLLEVLLRLYNPFDQRIRLGLLRLPTNVHYTIPMPAAYGLDEVVVHTRNNIGFRGPDLPPSRDWSLRILTVGGSTTECFLLSDDKTWPALLDRDLQRHFAPLWLNNAGLDGHSTFGHMLLIRNLDERIQPDLVLFLVGVNDVGRADANSYDLTGTPGLHFGSVSDFIKSLGNYSEVMSLVLNIRRALMAWHLQIRHDPHALSDRDLSAARLAPDQSARILADQAGPAAAYAVRLAKLVSLTRERRIAPVLVTQPALFGDAVDPTTHLDLSHFAFQGMDGVTAWDVLELYNEVTRRVAAEAGVPVIDLAREMPKDSIYFYDGLHFTNAGARAVSEIISRSLCPIVAARFPSLATAPCAG